VVIGASRRCGARCARLLRRQARFAGLRSVSYDGKTVSYGSDAELAAAIRDLEARVAAASGTSARRRRWGTVATKGL